MTIVNARNPRSATLLLALVLGACGDDGGGSPRDGDQGMDASASPDGASPSAGGGGNGSRLDGSAPDASSTPGGGGATKTCGGTRCPALAPELAALGASACCAEADRCGIETPFAPGTCLLPGAPGGADLACPAFTPNALFTWNGCCTPDGDCGALDGAGVLGCVANASLGAPESSCTYDPANTCERVLEVRCDGAEDCPGDRMCCGEFDGAGYRLFRCAASCAEREASTGTVWSQACHPGDACEVGGFECRASPGYLPDSLYRCRDSGFVPSAAHSTAAEEVNCGDSICGPGEKCCVSFPGLAAHCGPADVPCPCRLDTSPDDAGADDGG